MNSALRNVITSVAVAPSVTSAVAAHESVLLIQRTTLVPKATYCSPRKDHVSTGSAAPTSKALGRPMLYAFSGSVSWSRHFVLQRLVQNRSVSVRELPINVPPPPTQEDWIS